MKRDPGSHSHVFTQSIAAWEGADPSTPIRTFMEPPRATRAAGYPVGRGRRCRRRTSARERRRQDGRSEVQIIRDLGEEDVVRVGPDQLAEVGTDVEVVDSLLVGALLRPHQEERRARTILP